MINDLELSNASVWKYVDDTTVSEIVAKKGVSNVQFMADKVAQWSHDNRVQLNLDKCKELRISFAKNKPEFQPILINGKELEIVNSAKLLGVTITNDLSWNAHVNGVVKKASKRVYFLIQLKRAFVPPKHLGLFYTCCIRSVLDYAIPVFYYSLPNYLRHDLERVQKRALSIIYPNLDYDDALSEMNIPSLADHHQTICEALFNDIRQDKDHRLYKLLPPIYNSKYNLRRPLIYNVPSCKTNRFMNNFIVQSCIRVNIFK